MIKVLIVEDNLVIQSLIKEIVYSVVLDVEIFVASSGIEGFKILKDRGPFDILISDVDMPLMDGITMIRKARELGVAPGNMFIVSARERPEEDFLKELGVSHFFQKPDVYDGVVEAIKNFFK